MSSPKTTSIPDVASLSAARPIGLASGGAEGLAPWVGTSTPMEMLSLTRGLYHLDVSLEQWIIIALVVLLLVAWMRLRAWASRGTRRAMDRAQRAGAGEKAAERLLSEQGYRIVDRQVRCVWWIEIDGEEEEVELRADLLVERGGERFVAEVKTGVNAPDPAFPPTRRQLLEYALAFAPYGVLLVDMEDEEIMEVHFPRAQAR